MSLICIPRQCYNERIAGLDYKCFHEIYIPKEVCWNEWGTSCICPFPDEKFPNCTADPGNESIKEMLKEVEEREYS